MKRMSIQQQRCFVIGQIFTSYLWGVMLMMLILVITYRWGVV